MNTLNDPNNSFNEPFGVVLFLPTLSIAIKKDFLLGLLANSSNELISTKAFLISFNSFVSDLKLFIASLKELKSDVLLILLAIKSNTLLLNNFAFSGDPLIKNM